MARLLMLCAIVALIVMSSANAKTGEPAPLVDAYKAEYCGSASTWWYVSQALVDLMPNDAIVRVEENTYWWCATVDRGNRYSVPSSSIYPVADSGETECSECSDNCSSSSSIR